jgi:hypothetical protein
MSTSIAGQAELSMAGELFAICGQVADEAIRHRSLGYHPRHLGNVLSSHAPDDFPFEVVHDRPALFPPHVVVVTFLRS